MLGMAAKAAIPVVTAFSWYTAYKINQLLGEIAFEGTVDRTLQAFDAQPETLQAEIVQARFEDGLPLAGPDVKKNPRFRTLLGRPGRRPKIVFALAAQAYFQFGKRPPSEANMIITRKFMRDELEQYKDLRVTDALGIIDSALYMSFLPSQHLRLMNQAVRTRVYHERARDIPGTWWQRWNPWSTDHLVPAAVA